MCPSLTFRMDRLAAPRYAPREPAAVQSTRRKLKMS